MKTLILVLSFLILSIHFVQAQIEYQCGVQYLREAIIDRNSTFSDTLKTIYKKQLQQEQEYQQHIKLAATERITSIVNSPIPVVFHIIINQSQLNQLGGTSGILERIDSQMSVINRDFSALNEDSSLVPLLFKPLFANVGIRFALAHTTPQGNSTNGFEIIITDSTGFELSGGYGSGVAFSSVKYSVSGGAEAWDPTSYLNVWIMNPLNGGGTLNISGLTVPHIYVGSATGIPYNELGIMLNYGAFGIKTGSSQYYIASKTGGRTLTHELGHFFELRHTWGDDGGLCPDNGGEDDGIADTPPQANETFGCPSFPMYDACTKTGGGIMFMNYMDYTDDPCRYMFTSDQRDMMLSQTAFSAESYSLFLHPSLSQYPDTVEHTADIFSIYPNPCESTINILFETVPQDIQYIQINNTLGQAIQVLSIKNYPSGFYTFNVSALGKGMYFITINFKNGVFKQKLLKQ